MEEENNSINNFPELIQIFMGNVKKVLLTKTSNQTSIINNKEIIDSLFNLLDYQITFVHQIFLFNENNKENNSNNNNLDNLMNINKDILVSMIYKFLFNLTPLSNKGKNNVKNNGNSNINKYNVLNKNKIIFSNVAK